MVDQREIGIAVGGQHFFILDFCSLHFDMVCRSRRGSIRSVISSVGSALYISVLNNRLAQTIPSEVPPAIIQAGLLASSVPTFLQGLTSGSFKEVPGLNDAIFAAGTRAFRVAKLHAYSIVFYTTIAFTGVAVLLNFFSPDVDEKMPQQIAVTLHRTEHKNEAGCEIVERQKDVAGWLYILRSSPRS